MIRGYNFRYCVNYDHDTIYSCQESGCDDEGICRCGRIENAHIISVNVPEMVSDILLNFYDNSISSARNSKINSLLGGITKEVDSYTIDRILRINGVFESSNWEIQTTSGYYGDEISDIILEDSVAQKIQDQIDFAFGITSLNGRIHYLLNLEYGFILPELLNCSFQVSSIERDKLIFGSHTQYSKVSKDVMEWYSDKNYKSIRGIVIEKKDQYRLIDGYHRCFASENKLVKVLVAKTK